VDFTASHGCRRPAHIDLMNQVRGGAEDINTAAGARNPLSAK
jgi:hypothetical protein